MVRAGLASGLRRNGNPKARMDSLSAFAAAGASRLVTGDHPLLAALEARMARFKGTDAACLFGSGYLANTGLIPTLVVAVRPLIVRAAA